MAILATHTDEEGCPHLLLCLLFCHYDDVCLKFQRVEYQDKCSAVNVANEFIVNTPRPRRWPGIPNNF